MTSAGRVVYLTFNDSPARGYTDARTERCGAIYAELERVTVSEGR